MISSLRNRLHRVLLAIVVLSGLALPVVAADPAAATPGTSIASCSLSFSPSTFGPTDVVAFTLTSSPAPNLAGYGNDGLGPALANQGENTGSPATVNVPGLVLAGVGLIAPGTHSFEVYAVDASNVPTGSALCSTTYTYNATPAAPSFTTTALESTKVGSAYSAPITLDAGGDASALKSCTVTATIPGVTVTAGDVTKTCGTLSGTPTTAGSYTVTAQIIYQFTTTEPSAISTAATRTQSYGVKSTYTLTVAEGATTTTTTTPEVVTPVKFTG